MTVFAQGGKIIAAAGGVFSAVSGILPSAPTFLQTLLQGQTGQSQGVSEGTPNDFIPQSQSSWSLGWINPVPSGGQAAIAGNYIYRSDNPNTIYATVPVATGASNYSTYVSNSATLPFVPGNQSPPFPYQTGVDHFWTDSAATLATGWPAGSGPSYYQGDSWSYKVSAYDINGLEGPKSASNISIYFANGLQISCGGSFNGTIAFSDTSGGTTPLGFATSALWTTTAVNDLINPFTDFANTRWNQNIRAYTTLNLNVKPHQTGSALQMLALRVGDVNINPSGGTYQLPGLTANAWNQIAIPLASIMTDSTLGQQLSWYKADLQITTGGSGQLFSLEWYFS